jgi:hypothetical protein
MWRLCSQLEFTAFGGKCYLHLQSGRISRVMKQGINNMSKLLMGLIHLENGGTVFLRNICKRVPHYTESNPAGLSKTTNHCSRNLRLSLNFISYLFLFFFKFHSRFYRYFCIWFDIRNNALITWVTFLLIAPEHAYSYDKCIWHVSERCERRCVVVLQQSALLSPMFVAKSSNIFTQSP